MLAFLFHLAGPPLITNTIDCTHQTKSRKGAYTHTVNVHQSLSWCRSPCQKWDLVRQACSENFSRISYYLNKCWLLSNTWRCGCGWQFCLLATNLNKELRSYSSTYWLQDLGSHTASHELQEIMQQLAEPWQHPSVMNLMVHSVIPCYKRYANVLTVKECDFHVSVFCQVPMHKHYLGEAGK